MKKFNSERQPLIVCEATAWTIPDVDHDSCARHRFQPSSRGPRYAAVVPVAKCVDPFGDTILAYEMNGEPLPQDHGFPVAEGEGPREVGHSEVIAQDSKSPRMR